MKDKLTAFILDDEKHARDVLQIQIDKLPFQIEVIGSFEKGVDALEAFKTKKPDIIFLDIEMPVMNGFQFIDILNNKDIRIIFTTAYDRFAVNAFRVNAIDFLMKPIELSALSQAINKVLESYSRISSEDLERILSTKASEEKLRIGIPSVQGIEFFNTAKIEFCAADSNYTRIYFTDGSKILASKTLKEIEQMLPQFFYRPHHSYIVNLKEVARYSYQAGGKLELKSGAVIQVAKSRKKEILTKLQEL